MAFHIGLDLGGTKTEVIVLDDHQAVFRHRVATPATDYTAILHTLAGLVREADSYCQGEAASIGLGMPGAITDTGLVKNSNTVCLNGKPLPADLAALLQRPLKVMNDANCFALSEAVDGAAAGAELVFGVIIGTGVGGAVVISQQVLVGANSIAGEWGHTPLPLTAPRAGTDSRRCYCGKRDCVETYLCGAGLRRSFMAISGRDADAQTIAALAQQGDAQAQQVLALYQAQLAAALAVVINILDPQVIVLGGGLSNLPGLADAVEARLGDYVFSDTVKTRVVRNRYGDSSGVRGAAWVGRA